MNENLKRAEVANFVGIHWKVEALTWKYEAKNSHRHISKLLFNFLLVRWAYFGM